MIRKSHEIAECLSGEQFGEWLVVTDEATTWWAPLADLEPAVEAYEASRPAVEGEINWPWQRLVEALGGQEDHEIPPAVLAAARAWYGRDQISTI